MLDYLNIQSFDNKCEILSDIFIAMVLSLHGFCHLHLLYVLALCYGRSTNKIMNLSLVFFGASTDYKLAEKHHI